mgnify:CR=1 FL=1
MDNLIRYKDNGDLFEPKTCLKLSDGTMIQTIKHKGKSDGSSDDKRYVFNLSFLEEFTNQSYAISYASYNHLNTELLDIGVSGKNQIYVYHVGEYDYSPSSTIYGLHIMAIGRWK